MGCSGERGCCSTVMRRDDPQPAERLEILSDSIDLRRCWTACPTGAASLGMDWPLPSGPAFELEQDRGVGDLVVGGRRQHLRQNDAEDLVALERHHDAPRAQSWPARCTGSFRRARPGWPVACGIPSSPRCFGGGAARCEMAGPWACRGVVSEGEEPGQV